MPLFPSNRPTSSCLPRIRLAGLAVAVLVFGCGPGTDLGASSNSFGAMPAPFLHVPTSITNLTVHPSLASSGSGQAFERFRSGLESFPEAIMRLVHDQANPYLGVIATEVPQGAGRLGGSRYTLRFHVNGVPIAGAGGTATLLSDGSPFLLSTVPSLSAIGLAAAPKDWPDVTEARALLSAQLALPGSLTTVTFGASTKAYLAVNGVLLPVWKTRAIVNGQPYATLAGSEVNDIQPEFFDVTGSAKVNPRNVLQAEFTDFPLPNLVGDGTLTSNFLQTVVPTGSPQALGTANVFNFPLSDVRFAEASAYAHTQDQYTWITGLGFQWYGPQPLQIKVHALPNGTVNNALFIPGSEDDGTLPSINIGDGDGTVLKNLATDADVPKHEFGHHVIYQTLKTTTGESLVIHEALADTFVFLHNDDACLGKSICPEGSTACTLDAQCLRTGDNNFAYLDANWEHWAGPNHILGHKHSQVLSGLIWDLRKNGDMTPTELAQMALKTISYFKIDSGLRDFVLSMLTADRELFQCKHDAKIRQYLTNRNLATLISDVAPGCAALPGTTGSDKIGALNAPDPAAAATPDSTSPVSTASPPTDKRKGAKACGVAADAPPASPQALALLFLLSLAPLAIAARPVKAKARARRTRV